MAKYATLISDPELESMVIRAISTINGDLVLRAVSKEQFTNLEVGTTLVTNKKIDNPAILVNCGMNLEDITKLIAPIEQKPNFQFNKEGAEIICFVGLSGGVGTTTLAINYAFEAAETSEVMLVDFDNTFPDVARYLGLHHIEGRLERLGSNLFVSQSIPTSRKFPKYVFVLGTDRQHPILEIADEVFLVTKLGANTQARLSEISLRATKLIVNFMERSKVQRNWLQLIDLEFPRLNQVHIYAEPKTFELAAERKSALCEVAPNSLARKTIATLG